MIVMMISFLNVFGKSDQKIILPDFDDKYSKYVQQLEIGQLDIDYQDFRNSFIESQQYSVSKSKSTEFLNLRKEMYAKMNKSNYPEVIKITKQMLSIDYTSMLAHKILRQTYKIMGDTINAAKYETIQFGLLNSIVKNGDGKSIQTAWPVIQIEEEYFILSMLGAKLTEQALVGDVKLCDRMTVTEEGETKVYYFDVSKLFNY